MAELADDNVTLFVLSVEVLMASIIFVTSAVLQLVSFEVSVVTRAFVILVVESELLNSVVDTLVGSVGEVLKSKWMIDWVLEGVVEVLEVVIVGVVLK